MTSFLAMELSTLFNQIIMLYHMRESFICWTVFMPSQTASISCKVDRKYLLAYSKIRHSFFYPSDHNALVIASCFCIKSRCLLPLSLAIFDPFLLVHFSTTSFICYQKSIIETSWDINYSFCRKYL